ncbi:MAG: PHP domain-containing protein [Dehalococcoidia bacterium]|nr:PHP domain-containing protein [Dehalococcoidia bacterium]
MSPLSPLSKVDLHLHTTVSDGRLTPRQLVQLLAKNGVRYAAITDHDTTAGLDEAFEEAKAHPGLTLVPGIELSADVPGGEVHMLGLFLAYRDEELQQTLVRFREGRVGRARGMLERLAQLGMPLEWEQVQRTAGDASVGRPHVAQAMVAKGYVASTQEAFDRFLGRNGPAYVEREKLTPEEAIALVLRHQGLPVLAHPSYVTDLEKRLPSLCAAGLVGMEVFYKSYLPDMVGWLLRLARQHNLVPCGGTDYHGMGTRGEVEPGTSGPPVEVFQHLERLALQRKGQAQPATPARS